MTSRPDTDPPNAPAATLSPSEPELLRRIAAGDQGAFEILFREHYAALVGAAESLLRSREQAEDIVQDVLLNLWKHRETVRVQESIRAYLFRAVRNRALNDIRNERVRRDAVPHLEYEMSSREEAPPETVVEEELQTAIRAAIDDLPPRCREIFQLSREQGLKYSEIANVLGISVKTVETQMGRALKALRERLAPFLGGEGGET